ncbi:MAG: hypothetical protein KQA40_03020 [Candidatus Aenigmarchaeota archaeon]|nr:hypothetical protein [Candidatus Aenigmarchaeota archaeon]
MNNNLEVYYSLSFENMSKMTREILSKYDPLSLSKYVDNPEKRNEIKTSYDILCKEISKINKQIEKEEKKKNTKYAEKLLKYLDELNKVKEYLDEFESYIEKCNFEKQKYLEAYKNYSETILEKEEDIKNYREFSKKLKKFFDNAAIKIFTGTDTALLIYNSLSDLPISDGAKLAISVVASGIIGLSLYPSTSYVLDKYEKIKIKENNQELSILKKKVENSRKKYEQTLKESKENLFLKIESCFESNVSKVVYKKVNGKIKISPESWKIFDRFEDFYE